MIFILSSMASKGALASLLSSGGYASSTIAGRLNNLLHDENGKVVRAEIKPIDKSFTYLAYSLSQTENS